MSGLLWYKRYPRAALDGKMGMPPDVRGVYDTLLDLIYDEGGPLLDDPAKLASYCCCTPKIFIRIRDILLAAGKLKRTLSADGELQLMNTRAASVISEQEKYRAEMAKIGAAGGAKSRRKSSSSKKESGRLAPGKRALSASQATLSSSDRTLNVESHRAIQEVNCDSKEEALGADGRPFPVIKGGKP
jgi:uncharacterized protein YdaU (DUF1376 family)